MTDSALLHAFETFFATRLDATIKIHRLKPWENARTDLFTAVKALNEVLRHGAKIRGHSDVSIALEETAADEKAATLDLKLVLNNDLELLLDTFTVNADGCYPLGCVVKNGESGQVKALLTQEELIKRIWSHFEDPKCDLIKLLSSKYWP